MTEHPKFQIADDGTLLLNFGSYGEAVDVAAISGDGGRLLTVREVGVAVIWDAHSGLEVARMAPSSPLVGATLGRENFIVFIESAALNRDGTLALLGLNDRTAVIYRVSEALPLAVLHEDDVAPGVDFGPIRRVRYCGAPERALVGFPNRSVGVWTGDGSHRIAWLRPPSGEAIVSRPGVRDTLVSSLDLGSNGATVFAGAVDGSACVFELETGRVQLDAREHAEEILAVFDLPTGVGWATTAGSVWAASDVGPARKLLSTGERWREVAFDTDALLARGYDSSVVRWSFAGERELLVRGEPGRWSENAVTLAIAGERMHYPESGRRLAVVTRTGTTTIERDHQLVDAAFSPTGKLVTTQGWSDVVELWNARTGELRRTLPCPASVGCSAISAGDRFVAVGELGRGGGQYPRNVYVYSIAGGELVHTLTEHRWQVRQLAFSPNADLLASLGDQLIVFDMRQREVVLRTTLDRGTGSIAFAGDVLVACEVGRVHVFLGGQRVSSFPAPIRRGALWTLAHDGRFITIAPSHGLFRYDLMTGTLDRHVEPPFPTSEGLVPLELERYQFHSGSMLWRTEWGRFLHQSDGPRGWIQPLELSANGLVAVPCRYGAAVLDVGERSTTLRGLVPFSGRLRAGRIVGREVLLINETGRLFRAPLPGA